MIILVTHKEHNKEVSTQESKRLINKKYIHIYMLINFLYSTSNGN